MARTYKRDNRGRFAGGGSGGSGGGKKASGTGGRKQSKARVTTTGTFVTRQRAKVAQAARTAQFHSKATAGRGAKAAYKAAQGAARKAGKVTAPVRATGRTKKQAGRAQQARVSRFLTRKTNQDGYSFDSPARYQAKRKGDSWKVTRASAPIFRRHTVKTIQGNLFGGSDVISRNGFSYVGRSNYKLTNTSRPDEKGEMRYSTKGRRSARLMASGKPKRRR